MTIVRWLLVVAAVVLVLILVLWLFQRQLIYLPARGDVPAAGDVIPGAEDVTLTTSDGLDLGAWHVPAAGARRDVTVLVANGNAGNRADRAPTAIALRHAGFDVLLFDYRGYGENPGNPCEEGLARDVRAAYRFLIDDQNVSPERLLYFGESLGTGVVVELATEHPPAGLLLRSPYEELAAVGQQHYPIIPVRLLLRDRYPVAEQIANVDVPTTVVYGTTDAIIPPAQSLAVAQAAAGETDLVEISGAGHNDAAMFSGPTLVAAVERLADRSVH